VLACAAELNNDVVASIAQFQNLESLQLWETSLNATAAQAVVKATGLVIDDQIRCNPGTYLFKSIERLDKGSSTLLTSEVATEDSRWHDD